MNKEPEFSTGEDGRFHRRFWENIFCYFCGKDLCPDESYGSEEEPFPGICIECLHLILDPIMASYKPH